MTETIVKDETIKQEARTNDNDAPVPEFVTTAMTSSPIITPSLKSCLVQSQTSTDSTTESTSKRAVSFSSIHIRECERILDVTPSVSSGPALGLGWKHGETKTMTLEEYEEYRVFRSRVEFQMPARVRLQLLKEHTDATPAEIQRAQKQCTILRNQQRRSIAREGTVREKALLKLNGAIHKLQKTVSSHDSKQELNQLLLQSFVEQESAVICSTDVVEAANKDDKPLISLDSEEETEATLLSEELLLDQSEQSQDSVELLILDQSQDDDEQDANNSSVCSSSRSLAVGPFTITEHFLAFG